jgi:hypothetical protein
MAAKGGNFTEKESRLILSKIVRGLEDLHL